MRIKFKNLMLEVTRRCNMQCVHCMRGDAQDIFMDAEAVKQVFMHTSEIEQLSLTGGEPSLDPQLLQWIIYYAKSMGVRIGSFFCATNAKVYSRDFAAMLCELYALCEKPENCVLTVSTDQYHTTNYEVLEFYRELPFYKPEKEHTSVPRAEIILEGRAADNQLGRFKVPPETHIYDYELRGFRYTVNDRIYINALGDVLLNPDMSYDNQKKYNIGNIYDSPLDEILIDHFYRIPDHFYPDDKQCVFCVQIIGEKNTIAPTKVESRTYYATAQKAVAAYQSILNNLRYTPTDPQYGPIPDNLGLRYIEMPKVGDHCAATCIAYLRPDRPPRNVIVEIERCPIEEEFKDVRF